MSSRFKKGEGGRPKGVKNKHSFNAEELANKYEMQPLDFLMAVVNNDWKRLGFENANKVIIGEKSGIEFSIEEPNIKMTDRVTAAKEASKYLYSAKQAIALSSANAGLVIKVVDYTKKDG